MTGKLENPLQGVRKVLEVNMVGIVPTAGGSRFDLDVLDVDQVRAFIVIILELIDELFFLIPIQYEFV